MATMTWNRLAIATAVVAFPFLARADGMESDAPRLLQSHKTEHSSVPVAGTSIRAGLARTAVNASMAVVRETITDFGHYAEYMPAFERSRVLAKSPEGTDVYLRVPILHGAARLWAVVRFAPIERDGRGERVVGKMQGQGNIDDMRAVWRLEPVDDNHTILSLELLLVPKLPVPSSLVTEELEGASEKAVTQSRVRAEAKQSALGGIAEARNHVDGR